MLDFPRVSRMVGNVAIAIGLLEMIVALGFLVHAQSWHAGTVGTAGTVVAHERSTRATAGRGVSRPTYAEVVRFLDASGVQHEFRSRVATSDPFAVGEAVPVRYAAADPTDATIDSWFRLWGFPLIFVGAGLVFAAVGLAFRGIGGRIGGMGA